MTVTCSFIEKNITEYLDVNDDWYIRQRDQNFVVLGVVTCYKTTLKLWNLYEWFKICKHHIESIIQM